MLGMWQAQLLNNIAALLGVGVPASTNSYESISTVNVGVGGTGSITFSSIPSTYTHLQIRAIARTNRTPQATDTLKITANSITSYSAHQLQGDGASASAAGNGSRTSIDYNTIAGDGATASVFAGLVIDILDYANTSKYKTVRYLNGYDANGSGYIVFSSGAILDTAAINSITLAPQNGTLFKQYSSFALYGVK